MPAKLVPRMSKGGTIEPFPGVKITMVRAEHSSEMILKDPATGKDTSYAAGEPAGWIIELENGFKIYHMGDTESTTSLTSPWCRSAATTCSIPRMPPTP